MRYFACLLVGLLLAACTPVAKPLSCQELTNLRAQIGKPFTPDSLRMWIIDSYHVPAESILIEGVPGRPESYVANWREGGRTYYTVVLDQSAVKDISGSGLQATAKDVQQCLDRPQLYWAIYKLDIPGAQLGLDLVFPDSGLLAGGARFYQFGSIPKQPPPIQPDFPLSSFRLVKSGTTEEVLHNLFGELPSSDYEQIGKKYKPWPGDWNSIVIDIDPAMRK